MDGLIQPATAPQVNHKMLWLDPSAAPSPQPCIRIKVKKMSPPFCATFKYLFCDLILFWKSLISKLLPPAKILTGCWVLNIVEVWALSQVWASPAAPQTWFSKELDRCLRLECIQGARAHCDWSVAMQRSSLIGREEGQLSAVTVYLVRRCTHATPHLLSHDLLQELHGPWEIRSRFCFFTQPNATGSQQSLATVTVSYRIKAVSSCPSS